MPRAGVFLAAVVLALPGVSLPGARVAHALPPGFDADADGFADMLEKGLGSDPASATSTPEHAAVGGTCFDGLDNDGDGAVDDADPGCILPAPSDVTFPPAGTDAFDSSLTLDGYPLAVGTAVCRVDLDADGPVVVVRQAPAGSPAEIPVEMVAMQLQGTGTLRADPTCPLPPGDYGITILEDPAQASTGRVTARSADPSMNFPADSFFDVFFEIVADVGGTEVVLPGGPPGGPAGDPTRVTNVINTIPPYHGGKNTLCYQVPGLTHTHCPKAPPDHYLCYSGKFRPKFPRREVTLRDQFDGEGPGTRARVVRPLLFCNPASKNGEPLYEKTGHLECYALKKQKAEHDVFIRNQFNQTSATTKKAVMLCVPSEKNSEGAPQQLDHFKCYKGKLPKIQRRPVTLVDQFGIVETQALKPLFLCNPVSKDGSPVQSPRNHLECFKVAPKRVKQTVTAQNQFGSGTVKTKQATVLCLPTGKNEVGTTTTTVPAGSTTTTTLPGITLMLGWHHPTPGVPPSNLCGKVSDGPPGASGIVMITGPTPGTTTVQLNSAGVGRFLVDIFSFGTYSVVVTVNGQEATAKVTVDASDPGCP